jgi:hypothetical protein
VEQVPECRRFCRGRVVFRLEQVAGRHRGRLTALRLPLRFEERRLCGLQQLSRPVHLCADVLPSLGLRLLQVREGVPRCRKTPGGGGVAGGRPLRAAGFRIGFEIGVPRLRQRRVLVERRMCDFSRLMGSWPLLVM